MYLRSLQIEGVRSIERMSFVFDQGGEAGWHVVIGPNGSGKSTVVKAFALAMLGERDSEASLADLNSWRRGGRSSIGVVVEVPAIRPRKSVGPRLFNWEVDLAEGPGPSATATFKPHAADRPWRQETGWCSAAFGPYRRLSGGDTAYTKLFLKRPRLGAHLSALSEAVALTEAEAWLVDLHTEELEGERDLARASEQLGSIFLQRLSLLSPHPKTASRSMRRAALEAIAEIERPVNRRMRLGAVRATMVGDVPDRVASDGELEASFEFNLTIDTLSKRIIRFFNASGFLFDGMRIVDVRSDGVRLEDASGRELTLSQLSDGYRSVMSVGFEILRIMLSIHGLAAFLRSLDDAAGTIRLAAVVAIDEVEAHLHPPWQEVIGPWLRRCFPLVQFIVTTHSPIICRAVAQDGVMRGTVWQLPDPATGETSAEQITGQKLDRLVYGDLVEAVGTEAFGRRVAQSEESEGLLDRLAELNGMSLHRELDEETRSELTRLRRMFPSQTSLASDDTAA